MQVSYIKGTQLVAMEVREGGGGVIQLVPPSSGLQHWAAAACALHIDNGQQSCFSNSGTLQAANSNLHSLNQLSRLVSYVTATLQTGEIEKVHVVDATVTIVLWEPMKQRNRKDICGCHCISCHGDRVSFGTASIDSNAACCWCILYSMLCAVPNVCIDHCACA